MCVLDRWAALPFPDAENVPVCPVGWWLMITIVPGTAHVVAEVYIRLQYSEVSCA